MNYSGFNTHRIIQPKPANMKPTIGRIVHYQSYGTPNGEFKPEPRAAIITGLNEDGTISLCVLNPNGLFLNNKVSMGGPDADTPTPGCWNWPPRE